MQRTSLIAVLLSDLVLNISLLIAPSASDHTDLSGEILSFGHLQSGIINSPEVLLANKLVILI